MPSLGLLGALGGASEELLQDRKDQQKRERDLNDYEARAQFAATLQENLYKRKLELAQQFPTYTHFVTDSVTGDTRGYTPFGQVATLSAGDPEQKRLYTATRQAQEAQRNAEAARAGSQMGVDAAHAGLFSAQTDLTRDRIANPDKYRRSGSTDKPMSAAAYKTNLMLRAHEINPTAFAKLDPFSAMSADAISKQAEAQQAAINQAKAEFDQKGVHINEGLLQPSTDNTDDNEFMNAGMNDNEDVSNY